MLLAIDVRPGHPPANLAAPAGYETTASFRDPATDPTMEMADDIRQRGGGEPPETLAHYRVLKKLGEGGMGVIYLAEDTLLRRRVALKVMRPSIASSEAARKRFLREARAMAAIKHDHIVTVHQVGSEGDVPYLAMEYLRGMTLDRLLQKGQRMAAAAVLRFGREIASGLAAAHDRGLVHRDIKPSNLWLEPPRGRIKILDFGLARMESEGATELTQAGAILGTPAYMSPEQARGEDADARSDLFSLGCVLYRLSTGMTPFRGNTVSAALTSLAVDAHTPACQINPTLPPGLGDLIDRLLSKDRAGRPATARDVVAAIEEIESRETLHGRANDSLAISLDLSDEFSSIRPATAETAREWGPTALKVGAIGALVVAISIAVGWLGRPRTAKVPASAPEAAGAITLRRPPGEVGPPPPAAPGDTAPEPPTPTEEAQAPTLPGPPLAAPPVPPPVPLPDTAPPPKSLRWEMVHDVSLRDFLGWAEAMRARGYRPVFVSGHDLASRPLPGDGPDAPGEARIAAIAALDRGKRGFEIRVSHNFNEAGRLHEEMRGRDFLVSAQTTLTDGNAAIILAVYSRDEGGPGLWFLGRTLFPDPFVGRWVREGSRPFTVAGRPIDDTWTLVCAVGDARGAKWEAHHELTLDELKLVLARGKAGGFRPTSLFVCPTQAGTSFGAILSRDDPDLLWEAHLGLSAADLAADLRRMSARGFALDQVVGYAAQGASRYLVCWTRDPRCYPSTGPTNALLEGVDMAFEQFLIDRRIPSATLSVHVEGRLALSRGYGHADQQRREPTAPDAAMHMGNLCDAYAVAALKSLVVSKLVREDTPTAELLRARPGAGDPPATAHPVGTLKDLLADMGDADHAAAKRPGAAEAGTASADEAGRPAARGKLLARILEAVTGKPPGDVIRSRVLRPLGLTHTSIAEDAQEAGTLDLVASADDLGRFFRTHQLDGRPMSPRETPAPGSVLGRSGSDLALVLRRENMLVTAMLRLPADAPTSLEADLKTCLDRAAASITIPKTGRTQR